MEHKEFVKKYKEKKIDVLVNKSLSLKSISAGYLPKQYFWAHTLWSWIWFLSIPIGIILLFIDTVVGILVLFFVSFLGGMAVKKAASQFVLERALEDETFYQFAIESELIIIKNK